MNKNFKKLEIANNNGIIVINADGEKIDLSNTTEININLVPGICRIETTKATLFRLE